MLSSRPPSCRISSSFGSVHLLVPFCQLASYQRSPWPLLSALFDRSALSDTFPRVNTESGQLLT